MHSTRAIRTGAYGGLLGALSLLTFLLWGHLAWCALDGLSIAEQACRGVGVVARSSAGGKGPLIVLLEECHNSRATQIEHAITLLRLFEQHGLRHIGLEGYLKEDRKIDVDWFGKAAGNLTGTGRARVAVQLLKEGEISSAEFLKLIHPEVVLAPIETRAEYDVKLDDTAAMAPTLYLVKIAQLSLRQEHVPRIQKLQQAKKIKEMIDYILSIDPWTDRMSKALHDTDNAKMKTAEGQLKLVTQIKERAVRKRVDLSADEREAMRRNLAFWEGRVKASDTMVQSILGLHAASAQVVAMTIGAAHTDGMCRMLEQRKRRYAVVTPNSLKDKDNRGDLSWDMFERKYEETSVFSEGFMKQVLAAFPINTQKKPPPVLDQAWFQAKAELYLFTERIVRRVLGPPTMPDGGKPPFDFADDDLSGRWVRIDPSRIGIEQDRPGGGKVVLFPVTFNPRDSQRKTERWVKAGLGTALTAERERETIEAMLKRALAKVKEAGDPKEDTESDEEKRKKAEDEKRRVQITLNTLAGIAETKDTARQIELGI